VQRFAPTKDCQALFQLARLVHLLKPDLLHAHSSKAGALGRLAARLAGVPSIFTAHGWAFARGVPRIQRWMALPCEWIAARCCQKIIVVSEADYALGESRGIAPHAGTVVIHNGIPDHPSRAQPDGDSGQPARIASVARFAPQKDQSTLLQALAGVPFDYRLILVGDGPTRTHIESQAKALEISNQVEFLGARNDVAEILSRSHIFALTSHWEGFPLSILEAMRAGLPVLASSVGGVNEAVVDGETGFLVPRGDVAAVRDRLRQLLADPQLRSRMGAAGRRRFQQLFSLERMLEETVNVYREAVGAQKVG